MEDNYKKLELKLLGNVIKEEPYVKTEYKNKVGTWKYKANTIKLTYDNSSWCKIFASESFDLSYAFGVEHYKDGQIQLSTKQRETLTGKIDEVKIDFSG